MVVNSKCGHDDVGDAVQEERGLGQFAMLKNSFFTPGGLVGGELCTQLELAQRSDSMPRANVVAGSCDLWQKRAKVLAASRGIPQTWCLMNDANQ